MNRIGAAALASAALAAGAACGPPVPPDPAASFREMARSLSVAAAEAGATTVRGRGDWLFFAPELRHVSVGAFWGARAAEVSRARRADDADPLAGILEFAASLDAAGVELLVVSVPPKAVVYADELSPALGVASPPPRLDPDHQTFYARLREAGVDVLDLTEPLLAARGHPEGPVYCRHDTHWSGVGCVVAGRAIAAAVRGRAWYGDLPRTPHEAEWRDATITGDLTLGLDAPPPGERLRLREVRRAGAGRAGIRAPAAPEPAGASAAPPPAAAPGQPAASADPASPIVLLGDSHNLVFHAGGDMHATGAGLPDQLAFELGLPVDLVAVRGAASVAARVNLLRRAQRDPGYWEGKRMVVWCFAARELTEGDGWPVVPIRP